MCGQVCMCGEYKKFSWNSKDNTQTGNNRQSHDLKLQAGLEMAFKQNVFNLTRNQLIAKKKLATC